MQFEVIAQGLLLPEGPVAMPDGSVLLIDVFGGTLWRAWGDGRSEVVVNVGGGPNGAALGPDGAIYIANNGGFRFTVGKSGRPIMGDSLPDDYECGRIERIDLTTGRVDRLYDKCGDFSLRGPNDLVFDRHGGIWFTDLGKSTGRQRDISGLYYARSDGSLIEEAYFGAISFNGVGLSPDETKVYAADTFTGRLWEFEIESPGKLRRAAPAPVAGRLVGKAGGANSFDSLALSEGGSINVATIATEAGGLGGITTFTPEGKRSFIELPDALVTNICFGGTDRRTAYITCAGKGTLVRTQWPEPGLPLNFCDY